MWEAPTCDRKPQDGVKKNKSAACCFPISASLLSPSLPFLSLPLVRAAFGWRLRPPALSPHCSRGSESQSVANKIPSPTRNLETEPYQMPSTRQTPQTGPKRHLKNNTSHKCFRHQSAAIGTSVHSSHAHSGPSAWEAGV